MYDYLEFASSVQPAVQRVDSKPTLSSLARFKAEHGMVGLQEISTRNSAFRNFSHDTDGALYSGDERGSQWKFFSTIFTSLSDYKQGFNHAYLLDYPPYSPTTSLIANPANWSTIPNDIPRATRMFGQGTDRSFAINQMPSRGFGGGNYLGTGYGDSGAMTNLTDSNHTCTPEMPHTATPTKRWHLYQRQQTVKLKTSSFDWGVWIRQPKDDPFRTLNMAGAYVFRGVNPGSVGAGSLQEANDVYAVVCKAANHNPSLHTGLVPDSSDPNVVINQGWFNWSGLHHNGNKSGYKYRYNDYCNVRSLEFIDAEDCHTWTHIGGTVDIVNFNPNGVGAGYYENVTLSMFFAENHSNLDGASVNTGSIEFMNPYIIGH